MTHPIFEPKTSKGMNFIYSYTDNMEIIEEIVKVGERGQIVIPAKIRKKEKINSNTYLRVVDIDGKIVIDKVEPNPIEDLIESLASLGFTMEDWEEVKRERERDR